jgi:hypothetical protein
VTPRKCRPAKARYAELCAQWEAVHAAEQHAYRPLPKGIRLPEVIEGLRQLAEATGDPVLTAALAKVEAYDIERRRWEEVEAETYKTVYLPRMEQLVRRGVSVREAAAEIAVAWWIPGLSFEAVTKRLERMYRKAKLP